MSDQTLFEETNTTPATPVTDNVQVQTTDDGYGSMLQGIKTADGRQKYANLSDALNSIQPAGQHISTLESENSVLREELDSWKARLTAAEALSMQPSTTTGNPQTENTSTGIDVDAIVQQVQAGLSAQEQQKLYLQRVEGLKTQLVGKFGEKAGDIYKARLASIGISEKTLLDAEVQSPGAAWKFLGLDTESVPQTNSLPNSSLNLTSTQNKQTTAPKSYRPTGQARPGEKFAAQREETLKRLQGQGNI